jgi:hypothetical protein
LFHEFAAEIELLAELAFERIDKTTELVSRNNGPVITPRSYFLYLCEDPNRSYKISGKRASKAWMALSAIRQGYFTGPILNLEDDNDSTSDFIIFGPRINEKSELKEEEPPVGRRLSILFHYTEGNPMDECIERIEQSFQRDEDEFVLVLSSFRDIIAPYFDDWVDEKTSLVVWCFPEMYDWLIDVTNLID